MTEKSSKLISGGKEKKIMNKSLRTKTFLIITFTLMYLCSIVTILLIRLGDISFANPLIQVLQIIAGGSPTIAAFYIVFYRYNQNKKDSFLSRLFLFKVYPLWWAYAIILPFLILIFIHLIYYKSLNHISLEFNHWMQLPIVLVSSIFAGGLEEIGWRGVLFDEMKTKFSVLKITIIIGVLWAFWHLPLFFIKELAFSELNFFPYLLSTIMFSGFLNYLILKTRSIALAVLMHASINTAGNFGLNIITAHSLWNYLGLILMILLSFYLIYKECRVNKGRS